MKMSIMYFNYVTDFHITVLNEERVISNPPEGRYEDFFLADAGFELEASEVAFSS